MKPIDRPLPEIAYIVARSVPGGVIGCENRLPWKLRTDMQFFRSITTDHVIIMGRKTYESLGRPLPNRLNIVLSRNGGEDQDNLIWANSKEMALYLADFYSISKDKDRIMVIGGQKIYEVFQDLFTKIYLTEVFCNIDCGDAFFKVGFNKREWNTIENKNYPISEGDEFPFMISVLEKRRKYVRHRDISDFYVNNFVEKVGRNLPKLEENLRILTNKPEKQILLPLAAA